MATGAIDDVKVFLNPDESTQDEVSLVFKVLTKARIGTILFEGNSKLSKRKLEKSIQISLGELLDEAEIKADQKALEELYLEKGYWNSRVDSQVVRKQGGRSVTVIFTIVENEKRKISLFCWGLLLVHRSCLPKNRRRRSNPIRLYGWDNQKSSLS